MDGSIQVPGLIFEGSPKDIAQTILCNGKPLKETDVSCLKGLGIIKVTDRIAPGYSGKGRASQILSINLGNNLLTFSKKG